MKKNLNSLKINLLSILLVSIPAFSANYFVDNNNKYPTIGRGEGVAIGESSTAPKEYNVAIGKGSTISYSNGDSNVDGDVAIGKAYIDNYLSQGGSVAIGYNARVENRAGGVENYFLFGQSTPFIRRTGFFSFLNSNANPEKLIGSVAIGNNTFARSGSVMIGSNKYKGKIADISDYDTGHKNNQVYNALVYSTTVGSNSINSGAFSTNYGAYNAITSDYYLNGSEKAAKNFGSVINGSFNSIESYNGGEYSGIASSIVGTTNKISNSNGALIYGAGNEIENSYEDLSNLYNYMVGNPVFGAEGQNKDVKDFTDSLRLALSNDNSPNSGSTGIFGGGNKASYTYLTSIIGVKNKINGEVNKISSNNLAIGFKNTQINSSHIDTIGSFNKVNNSENIIINGNNHNITEGSRDSVFIGFNSTEGTDIGTVKNEANNIFAIGNDIKASVDNSVFLGSKSSYAVSNYNLEDKSENGSLENIIRSIGNGEYKLKYKGYLEKYAGKISDGIVSIGYEGHERRLQNLAAGLISDGSTDAINGSQLYHYIKEQGFYFKNGENSPVFIKLGDTINFLGTNPITIGIQAGNTTIPSQPTTTPSQPTTNPNQTGTTTVTIGADVYTKSEINDKLDNKVDKSDIHSLTSEELVVENGESSFYGTKDIKLSIKDGSIVENKLSKEVQEKINKKVDASIINNNYYEKAEIDSKLITLSGGVSNAMAMSSLPQIINNGKYLNQIAAGYSTYGGVHSIALGLSGTNEKENIVYKVQGSLSTKGNVGFGVGLGYQFIERKTTENSYEEEIYKLKEENKTLREKMTESINNLIKEIEILKKQIKK